MTGDLEAKVRHAPRRPGVYLMKEGTGEILYVGKARDLKARIRAYFARTDARAMIPFLVSRIRDVEFIITGTEKEALILENNLIKEHRPRFNIVLRDDKSYPYVKVTVQEPYPRVLVTRRVLGDGARYYGPFTDVGAMRHALNVLKRVFTVRS